MENFIEIKSKLMIHLDVHQNAISKFQKFWKFQEGNRALIPIQYHLMQAAVLPVQEAVIFIVYFWKQKQKQKHSQTQP